MGLIDSVVIDGVDSYDEYEASVKERVIEMPKKKSIRETVPYSNMVYDFSEIDGELYWDNRTIQYVFEILADSPEALEDKKQPFIAWLMNVQEKEIHDPYITDYYFLGTFDTISVDDSEIEKSTITVTFSCYPYKISKAKKMFKFSITADEIEKRIFQNSCHQITPTFRCDVPCHVVIGDKSYDLVAGDTTDNSIKIDSGINTVKMRSKGGDGTLCIEFYEEIF